MSMGSADLSATLAQLSQMRAPLNKAWDEAIAAARAGDYAAALAGFDNQAPSAKMCYNRAMTHLAAGKTDQALEQLDEAIKLDEFMAVAWLQRALLRHRRGDMVDALAEYTRTLELVSTAPSGYVNMDNISMALVLGQSDVLYNRAVALAQLGLCANRREPLPAPLTPHV